MYQMTPWVTRILIANVAMFFVTAAMPDLTRLLWFYPPAAFMRPWTVVTYMFLHGGFGHGRDFLWTWLREARSRSPQYALPGGVFLRNRLAPASIAPTRQAIP